MNLDTSTKNIENVLECMNDAHTIGHSTMYKHLKDYCAALLAERLSGEYKPDTTSLMMEYQGLVAELDYLMTEDMYVAWEPE